MSTINTILRNKELESSLMSELLRSEKLSTSILEEYLALDTVLARYEAYQQSSSASDITFNQFVEVYNLIYLII